MAWEDRDYSRPPPQLRFGPVGGAFSRRSIVFWLIVINAGVLLLDALLARVFGPVAVPFGDRAFGMKPLEAWGHFSYSTAILGGQVWRFVTFQFLHGGGWHLFGNVLGLFFFGPMIERHLGSKRFLAYYLLCGSAGAVMYLLLWALGVIVQTPETALVGASGGVFAILAGAALIAPNATVLLFFILPIPLRVLVWIILFGAVYAVVAGGTDPGSNAGGHAAHLGGMALGFWLIKHPGWLNWADRFSPDAVQARYARSRYEKKRRRQQAEQAEVDRILDKVRTKGLHSLSRHEKRVLNQATERSRRAG